MSGKRPMVPVVVKVGPHPFKVVWVRAANMKQGGTVQNGYCDLDKLEIQLRRGMRRAKAREVLLHEVMHAMHLVTGATDNKARSDEEWIEATVHTLLQVTRDNPELHTYLISD